MGLSDQSELVDTRCRYVYPWPRMRKWRNDSGAEFGAVAKLSQNAAPKILRKGQRYRPPSTADDTSVFSIGCHFVMRTLLPE